MGTYCEMTLSCYLKQDVSDEVIGTLKFFLSEEPHPVPFPSPYPIDKLFYRPFYSGILKADSEEFPAGSQSSLRFDSFTNRHCLVAWMHMKASNSVMKLFLVWLAPFSSSEGHVGYMRYTDDYPIQLIYFENNKVYLVDIVETRRTDVTASFGSTLEELT